MNCQQENVLFRVYNCLGCPQYTEMLKEVTLEMYERFLVDFALIRYFLWEGVFVMKGG